MLEEEEMSVYTDGSESVHRSRLTPTLCNTNAKPAVSN